MSKPKKEPTRTAQELQDEMIEIILAVLRGDMGQLRQVAARSRSWLTG